MILNCVFEATKKPILVNYFWFEGDLKELSQFLGKHLVIKNQIPYLLTRKGRHEILKDHYIIQEEKKKEGEFYMITKDEFDETFDIVKKSKKKEENLDK